VKCLYSTVNATAVTAVLLNVLNQQFFTGKLRTVG